MQRVTPGPATGDTCVVFSNIDQVDEDMSSGDETGMEGMDQHPTDSDQEEGKNDMLGGLGSTFRRRKLEFATTTKPVVCVTFGDQAGKCETETEWIKEQGDTDGCQLEEGIESLDDICCES